MGLGGVVMTKVNEKHVGWGFWLWRVLASTIGFPVGAAAAFIVSFNLPGAVGGAVVGILQWLVLRQQLSRTGWWVLASTVGFPVGAAVYVAVFQAVNLALGGDLSAAFIERAMGFAVAGAVVGAITGTALVWLLRQPKLEE